MFYYLRAKLKRSMQLAHTNYINTIKDKKKSFWKYIGGFIDHITWPYLIGCQSLEHIYF